MKSAGLIVAANWKMHKSPQEGYQFARRLKTRARELPGVRLLLFPPATSLLSVHEALKESAIELGGQHMHPAREGAFTGEISAGMMVACGCRWVLIGHSERRHLYHESDADVEAKIPAALAAGLKVMLCVGERLEQREDGRTEAVLRQQLEAGLASLKTLPGDSLVIAYEPVWAIGTGVVAHPEQVAAAHGHIRTVLGTISAAQSIEKVAILYGGSVNSSNAAELIRTPGVDGFLVGGASLDIDEYCKIAQIALLNAEVNS